MAVAPRWEVGAPQPHLVSVGHGTASAAELTAVLAGAGIALVVDIRRYPASRRHPQFSSDEMERWLLEAAIAYRSDPDLGGRRMARPDSAHVALRQPSFRGYADHMETPDFGAALERLLRDARFRPVAMLCSESLWWRCHRRLVADAAMLTHGGVVLHLGHDGRMARHQPTDGVRVDGARLVYDAGVAQPLPTPSAPGVPEPADPRGARWNRSS